MAQRTVIIKIFAVDGGEIDSFAVGPECTTGEGIGYVTYPLEDVEDDIGWGATDIADRIAKACDPEKGN